MNRETENALLLLVGVGIAMVTLTGAFTRYVRPGLQPWLLIAAAVLVVLAVVAMVRDIRAGSQHPDDPHEHAGHRAGTAWLLLVPVVLLVFVVPPAISPRTARATATVSDGTRRPFPPLPDTRAPELTLPELLIRIAHDSAGTVEHRTLTVSGFTLRDGGQTDLGRVVIICCAADAQLARIALTGPGAGAAASLPDDTWVRLEGTVAQPDGQGPPHFDVTRVTPAPRPANAYSY